MLNRKRQGAGSDRKRRPFSPPLLSRDEKNPNTQIFPLFFSSSTASQKPQLTRQTPRPSCWSCTRSRPGSGPRVSAWLRCSRVRREERVFFAKQFPCCKLLARVAIVDKRVEVVDLRTRREINSRFLFHLLLSIESRACPHDTRAIEKAKPLKPLKKL
jgi:hypothetical protein